MLTTTTALAEGDMVKARQYAMEKTMQSVSRSRKPAFFN